MLLTLAIPTYNRSEVVLDKVHFLLNCLNGSPLMDDCELLVIDNASTDETYENLRAIALESDQCLKVYRNRQNIGLVANCLRCIELSKGKYVWIIGDDDPLKSDLLHDVYKILKELKVDINLLHLNHNCIDKTNGPILIESFYGSFDTELCMDGKKLFNKLITANHTGGFMFISANIIHREQAQKILDKTSNRYKRMLGFPMFLNSFLALTGSLYYFSDIKLTCVYNQSSWIDRYIYLNTIELPVLWIKLLKHGLTMQNLKNLVFKHSLLYKNKSFSTQLKEYLKDFKYFPYKFKTDVKAFALRRYIFLILKSQR